MSFQRVWLKIKNYGNFFLTPTTKGEDHDRPISGIEIVLECMAKKHFDVCAKAALEVLAFDRKLVGRESSHFCRYKV